MASDLIAHRYAGYFLVTLEVIVLVDEFPAHLADDNAGEPASECINAKALQHAIAGLPPGQRSALELLKFREMSLKQASALSGMSIGALKVSVHRATKTLRGSLDW